MVCGTRNSIWIITWYRLWFSKEKRANPDVRKQLNAITAFPPRNKLLLFVPQFTSKAVLRYRKHALLGGTYLFDGKKRPKPDQKSPPSSIPSRAGDLRSVEFSGQDTRKQERKRATLAASSGCQISMFRLGEVRNTQQDGIKRVNLRYSQISMVDGYDKSSKNHPWCFICHRL